MFANRAKSLRQHQAGGLESVFGILVVLQDAPADPVDHRPVPAHDGLENGFVLPREKPLDKLPVGLVSERCRHHPPRQATQEVAYVCRCHVCLSPPCPCSPYSSSARERNVANFSGRIIFKESSAIRQRGPARWKGTLAGCVGRLVNT